MSGRAVTDAQRTILRTLFDRWVTGEKVDWQEFRIEHRSDRALLDKLRNDRLMTVDQAGLRPTLGGVLECPSKTAQDLLEMCSEKWALLDRAYSDSPQRRWTVEELAERWSRIPVSGRALLVQNQLELMTDLRGWYASISVDASGRIESLHLTEGIFDVNVSNWIERYWAQAFAERDAAKEQPLPVAQMTAAASAPLIFVSHSRSTRDEKLATALDDALTAAGVATFKASRHEQGVPGGRAWFENIMGNLRAATGLVFVATPQSITEPWPLFEVGAVFGRECAALTILTAGLTYEDAPGPLKSIQNVTVAEEEGKIRAKLADIAGRKSEELWGAPGAVEKLGAFLNAARVQVAPSKELARSLADWRSAVESAETEINVQRRANAPVEQSRLVMARVYDVAARAHQRLRDLELQQGLLNVLEGRMEKASRLKDSSLNANLPPDMFWRDCSDVLGGILQLLAHPDVGALVEARPGPISIAP